MGIYLDTVAEESEFAATQKAGEFYRKSSLPQKQEGMAQAVAALYELVKQLPEGKDRICMNNLKQLGLAIAIYANDHKDALPGSLEVLAGRYVTDQAILKCPVSGTPYVYVGKGLKLDAKPTSIIAYDDTPVHSGSRHALFVDGHVGTLPEGAFTERLRQQQQPDQPVPGATQ
jgi:prepilin-type processing-associated H-X9-DG protein